MTEETFAQAVRTYGDTVYRVAFHALNSREDAEDVTQTVMLKLFEYGKEFESEAHLKHWLLRVWSMRAESSCAPSGGVSPSHWTTGASWRPRSMGNGRSCWRR